MRRPSPMEETMEKIFMFGILCLAAWRLASLTANERGPFHFFEHLRKTVVRIERRVWIVRQFHLYEMISCEWCNSVWFGIALWLGWKYIGNSFVDWMTPLAISTVVIVLKFVVQGLELLNKSMVQSEEEETEVSPTPQTA